MTLLPRSCRNVAAPNRLLSNLLSAALISLVLSWCVQAQGVAGAKSASSGTLLLSSNIACRVFLDGEEAAKLAAGDVKKVPVELGDHLLVAKNDKGEVIWKKAVSVKSSAQILVEIGSTRAAPASGSLSGSPKAASTLLVKTGVACKLTVNGNEAGDLPAGGSKVIPVTSGKQVVAAAGRKGARWEKTVEVKGPGQITVNVAFPRFEDQGDGTVLDTKTGLIWARKNSEFDVDFEQAKTYAEKLALGNQRDWRIPSIGDLETLLNSAARTGASAAFELTERCTLWSTTKDEGGLTLMYDRGGRVGYPAQARGNTRVLCVRGAAE